MRTAYVNENHRNWGKYLPKVFNALRSAPHEAMGLSPDVINFGLEVKLFGTDNPPKIKVDLCFYCVDRFCTIFFRDTQ